jgi:cytidylate kinase
VPPPPARPPFSIAISREAGALGSRAAAVLGEQLGWPVYDRELLQRLANEMGLDASTLESVDEKRTGWLLWCLQSFFSRPEVCEDTYVRHLVRVLLGLAAEGECVIVGRGAAQILPPETTLRVRMVAPLKDRIVNIQQKFKLSPDEAARKVEAMDKERSLFVKDHFNKDAADPKEYDLILNSSRFPVEECARLIVEALHCMQHVHAPCPV